MKLLHLTDIHLTTPGETIVGRDPNANFDRALEHAMAQHSDAEAMFITGDLSDTGEPDDYARLKDRIRALPMPVHLGLGNHDIRGPFLSQFPEHDAKDGFVQYTVALSQGHAIMLDTLGENTHRGHFCETRAAWLNGQLKGLPGPVWIFMHHNPVPTGIGSTDVIMLVDASRFVATVKPHRNKIAHVFHGHCHMALCGSFHGISFSAPRSTNHQGWPDFSGSDTLLGADLTETYSVIFATPDSTMVHPIEFGHAGEIFDLGPPE